MNTVTKNVLLILGWICGSCSSRTQFIDTEVVIIIDRTDPMDLYPASEAITSQLGLKADPWQGVRIVLSYISDRDVNGTNVISLPKEYEWRGNKTIRLARIEQFKRQLDKCLRAMKSKGSCAHSVIYRTVAKQCNRLATSEATNKYVVIYSNLLENSEVNFYNHQTLELLHTNPEIIQQHLASTAPLSTLKGMQIWLLYDPKDFKDNSTYMSIAHFYQQLLQTHGATVHIENKFLLL